MIHGDIPPVNPEGHGSFPREGSVEGSADTAAAGKKTSPDTSGGSSSILSSNTLFDAIPTGIRTQLVKAAEMFQSIGFSGSGSGSSDQDSATGGAKQKEASDEEDDRKPAAK